MRWSPDGKATLLPGLPGHAWTDAFSINDEGVVSGWSRKLPNDDGEENPVLWTPSGKVVPLKTAPGRADGIAEATNRSGLDRRLPRQPRHRRHPGVPKPTRAGQRRGLAVTNGRARACWAPCARPLIIAELVDVNDRGQAAGMSGTLTEHRLHRASPDLADRLDGT